MAENPNNVKITSTLDRIMGSSLQNSLLVKYVEDVTNDIERPDLEDIASVEQACLLGTKGQPELCELDISSDHKLGTISLISDCRKVEFFGEYEYAGTAHGELVDDCEGVKVFRFDISMKEYNTTKATIKLIPKSTQFWIYGITILLVPNLNASQNRINLENVQNILENSSQKLSPNAEKCKAFLKSYMSGVSGQPCSSKNVNQMQAPNMDVLMSYMNANFEAKQVNSTKNETKEDSSVVELKESFEHQLSDLESRMDKKFSEQDQKLDTILKLLQKNTL